MGPELLKCRSWPVMFYHTFETDIHSQFELSPASLINHIRLKTNLLYFKRALLPFQGVSVRNSELLNALNRFKTADILPQVT